MNRRRTLGASLGAALAVSATLATGGALAQERAAHGNFSLLMMVHTSSSSFGNLPGVNPWNGSRRSTERHVYRSIPCTGNAPVNNISSDLPTYGARVHGSRVPSSLRAHPYSFRIRQRRGGVREMVGRITFTVCQLRSGPTPTTDPVADADKPKIYVSFRARFQRTSTESTSWAGTFRITGGTQRYEDLEGVGTMAGYHFCFNPAGCASFGGTLLDGQFAMQGTYRDPTPQLRAR